MHNIFKIKVKISCAVQGKRSRESVHGFEENRKPQVTAKKTWQNHEGKKQNHVSVIYVAFIPSGDEGAEAGRDEKRGL